MRFYLRSKLHKATVTEANVDYIGSIEIDKALIQVAGFEVGEKVSVWDITNGERLETYIIEGAENSGIIGMNGAAAKKIHVGDQIIIAGFELSDTPVQPTLVLLDEQNKFSAYL